MEKLLIFAAILVFSIIMENAKKKKRAAKDEHKKNPVQRKPAPTETVQRRSAPKPVISHSSDDVGQSILEMFETVSKELNHETKAFAPKKKKKHTPAKKEHNFFDEFIEEEPVKVQKAKRQGHRERKQAEKDLRLQQIDQLEKPVIPLVTTKKASKKASKKHSLDFVDTFGGLKKGIIYKEILDKPISLR